MEALEGCIGRLAKHGHRGRSEKGLEPKNGRAAESRKRRSAPPGAASSGAEAAGRPAMATEVERLRVGAAGDGAAGGPRHGRTSRRRRKEQSIRCAPLRCNKKPVVAGHLVGLHEGGFRAALSRTVSVVPGPEQSPVSEKCWDDATKQDVGVNASVAGEWAVCSLHTCTCIRGSLPQGVWGGERTDARAPSCTLSPRGWVYRYDGLPSSPQSWTVGAAHEPAAAPTVCACVTGIIG